MLIAKALRVIKTPAGLFSIPNGKNQTSISSIPLQAFPMHI
jgi:hypothetical protein